MIMLSELRLALQKSWSKKTCCPSLQKQWNTNNAALGQCAVTALIVQDFLGGVILYCKHQNHFFNRVNGIGEIDFTKSQFSENIKICADQRKYRKSILKNLATFQRYTKLKQKINKALEKKARSESSKLAS